MGPLNHSPADVVRHLLLSKGLGTLPTLKQAWPISVSHMADRPDNAAVIHDTVGYRNGRLMATGEVVDLPGFEIIVRGQDHATGFRKVNELAVAMDTAVYQDTVRIDDDTYFVHCISNRHNPRAMGTEPNTERQLFSLNATVTLDQVA